MPTVGERLMAHNREVDRILSEYPAQIGAFMRANFRLDLYPAAFARDWCEMMTALRRTLVERGFIAGWNAALQHEEDNREPDYDEALAIALGLKAVALEPRDNDDTAEDM